MENTLRPIPFVRLVIPLLLGIGTAEYLPLPLVGVGALLLGLLSCVFVFVKISHRFRWVFGLFFLPFLFLLGQYISQNYDERNAPDYFAQYINHEYQGGYTEYIGTIAEMPKDGEKNTRSRINLKAMQVDGSWEKVSGSVMANFRKDSTVFSLAYGDKLVFQARMNPTRSTVNKGSFDYARYLHFQNIHHNTYLATDEWQKLDSLTGNPLWNIGYFLRKKAVETLRKHLTTENEFAVGAALVVGYKDEITEEVQLAYAGTGAMHVLAVSGLHVGIVYMIISFLFNRIKSRHPSLLLLRFVVSVGVIWGFAMVTGAAPSVLRAATMFSFVIFGDLLSRQKNIYNTLSAAAFVTLICYPYLLFSPGFQLSYLAVLGIVFFQPLIYKSWYVENRIGKGIWALISVSLAAQLTTLPVSLYYFHQFPTYFWLSGLVVVPAAPFVLGGGLLLFLAEALFPPLAVLVGWLLSGLIWFINSCIFFIQKMPFNLIENIHISFLEMLMGYLIIGLIAAWLVRDDKRMLFAALGVGLLMSVSITTRNVVQSSHKEVVFYHVYKGYLIDYFHHGQRVTFRSEGLLPKSEDFAAEGYRMIYGTKEYGGATPLFMQQGDFLQCGDKRMYFLNENYYDTRSIERMEVDVVVLQDNPFVNFDKLLEEFDFDYILADGSNKQSRVRFWRKACNEKGIPFHYTGDGMFSLAVGNDG